MTRILVLGEVTAFRRIVVSVLRSGGAEVSDADIGAEGMAALTGQQPDVVIVHLDGGAFSEAYFERITIAARRGRIVVIEESGPLPLRARAPSGVLFLSRAQLRELAQSVRGLTLSGR